MEYLENFKSRFENYYKTREVPKTRECIVENLLATRRTTRAQFLTERRNITEDILSPSPVLMVSAGKQKQQKSPAKKMDRLARMKLWRAEKLKKKEEEKAKTKPLFKVGAKSNVGFPNINGSKQIVKKSFAPNNHVFKAPNNVKAIEFMLVKKTIDTFKRVTRSQKAVASSPLSLPARTRKKQDAKKNEQNLIKNKNKLTRQNAFDSVLKDTNKADKPTVQNTESDIKAKKSNAPNKENISSKIDGNEKTDTRSKRRSLRLNVEYNVETSIKKTPSKRKSMQKNVSEIEDNTKTETSNKRQSRRKSFRKSTSNGDKESDLNSTYELINPDQTTPIKDDVFSPVSAYISPFVTTSRGKGSIRKENKERSIRGKIE